MIREDSTRGCFQDRRARNRRRGWCSLLCRPIPVCRAVANGIVGAAIGRPSTNCIAICWFSAGKQCIIALWRCDFVAQNHAGGRWPPLHSQFNSPINGNLLRYQRIVAICKNSLRIILGTVVKYNSPFFIFRFFHKQHYAVFRISSFSCQGRTMRRHRPPAQQPPPPRQSNYRKTHPPQTPC